MYHANTSNQKVEVARLILDKLNIWTRRKTSLPKITRKFYNDKNDSLSREHAVLNVYAPNKNLKNICSKSI